MTTPYILGPGESRWGLGTGGLEVGFLTEASESDHLVVFRYDAPPGFPGPAQHVHHDIDEGFFVLEGTLRVRAGDEIQDIDAGGFAWVPGGAPHGFANVSDAPVRFLGLAAPPGRLEAMFRDMADYLSEIDGRPDPERMNEINTRHGIEIVAPPLGLAE